MKLEEELERRVREPAILMMPNNSVVVNNNRIPAKQSKKMLPKPPRDIETLISTNLSKLRSTSPQVNRFIFP